MNDRDRTNRDELLELLDNLRAHIASEDSCEGSVLYRVPDTGQFELHAVFRTGGSAGPGRMSITRAEPRIFQSYEIENDPRSFVGKTVTLAGKDPIRWDRTTITGYDASSGHLILAGGYRMTRVFDPKPDRTPVVEDRVYPYDIARGTVHHCIERL
ncbi:hypothetical protein GCM10029978_067210 [Actinoallomurus acanthiterrae]